MKNYENEEFIEMIVQILPTLQNLFPADCMLGVADKYRYIKVCDPKTFNLPFHTGTPIMEGGVPYKAFTTGQSVNFKYPIEKFGVAVSAFSSPIKNRITNEVIATLTCVINRNHEFEVNSASIELQNFVENLSASSEELAGAINETSEGFNRINERSQNMLVGFKKLEEITDFLKKVADTSNLLGLNALIESARAGESGKTFKVVAEEIRKLAQDSAKSVKEIEQFIKYIQEDLHNFAQELNTYNEITQQQSTTVEELAIENQKLAEISMNMTELASKLI